MKKSLVAVALLGAFAASAFAAPSVTLYGRIDTGLAYTHQNLDQKGVDSTDTLEMTTGWSTGSRWGLKGTEDIGNAKVGFVLESGFNSDDGTSGQDGRLFGREAQVNVSGAYGTLYAGRLATIVSDAGSLGLLGNVSAFPNGYGIVGTMKGSTGSGYDRYDNTIAYKTPTMAGFTVSAMYSFKGNDLAKNKDKKDVSGAENKASATRYAAAGLQYKGGKFTGVLAGDYTMWGNDQYGRDLDDGYTIVLGGNYDFGVAQVFAKATYFDNAANALDSFKLFDATNKDTGVVGNGTKAVKGWGLEVSTKVPAFGGNFLATVGYRDAKDVDHTDIKYHRWNAAVGYAYPFSKRTNVYAAAGYAQEKAKGGQDARTPNAAQVGLGLVHKF
ncbi:porin [Mesosutterella sp. OilRF-GAM-744-9]|uniref:Porin n=1 Tax=Mesosutterella porci TaxID=2915351 RepID=A0ABS9MPX5_9BURK|nr:porin [Mesosutterella sp. oilRF-744-WT-GAM-9]MCG5030670.1 porin [Mesosutterella sp. oilRF-744-WT-GAM-9]